MKDRAPTTPPRPLPVQPRRLTAQQGFTASEHPHPTRAIVQAHWVATRQGHFELTYSWLASPVPSATYQLAIRTRGQPQAEVLVAAQHVRRLQEARQLHLGSLRYRNARLPRCGISSTVRRTPRWP